MPTVPFTDALRREYENLFNTCIIRPERVGAVEESIVKLHANKNPLSKRGRDIKHSLELYRGDP